MSDGKSKFKVGDRVRFLERYGAACAGDEATVTGFWDKGVRVDVRGEPHSCFFERVALVEPPSPIRTVMRREIVPGNYDVGDTTLHIFSDFGALLDDWSDVEALRESAHLFNQLAEVLEGNTAESKAA